jgi:hypothetical protein
VYWLGKRAKEVVTWCGGVTRPSDWRAPQAMRVVGWGSLRKGSASVKEQ